MLPRSGNPPAMYLKTLHLQHFRNYTDQQITFSAPKTILVGNNAQGKSNLLEAVELLATLRSHRASRDRDLVQKDQSAGHIHASLDHSLGTLDLAMTLRGNGRRSVSRNAERLSRQLDFLGSLNAVQFSSLDLDLVRGGPDQRRLWLDTLLAQLEPVYARILQDYNRVLRQRNSLLKQIQASEASPTTEMMHLLDQLSHQLVVSGGRVVRRRARAIARLAPIAAEWHQAISGLTEHLTMAYAANIFALPSTTATHSSAESRLLQLNPIDDPKIIQDAFCQKLQSRTIAERYQGATLAGPHRDEVEFTINKTPARQYGSQGQQRTLVLALKLAELQLIEEVVQDAPLLLLDDVLAELDPGRQRQLLTVIQDRFQTLITTTHLDAFGTDWLKSSQVLNVCQGQIRPI